MLSPFCGICGGFPGFRQNPCRTKKSAAKPRYVTSETQNFLLNKGTWLLTLTFGRCVGMYSSGLSGGIVGTKPAFCSKNARKRVPGHRPPPSQLAMHYGGGHLLFHESSRPQGDGKLAGIDNTLETGRRLRRQSNRRQVLCVASRSFAASLCLSLIPEKHFATSRRDVLTVMVTWINHSGWSTRRQGMHVVDLAHNGSKNTR